MKKKSGLAGFKPAKYKSHIKIKIFRSNSVEKLEEGVNNYLTNLEDNQTFEFIKQSEYEHNHTIVIGTTIRILEGD